MLNAFDLLNKLLYLARQRSDASGCLFIACYAYFNSAIQLNNCKLSFIVHLHFATDSFTSMSISST